MAQSSIRPLALGVLAILLIAGLSFTLWQLRNKPPSVEPHPSASPEASIAADLNPNVDVQTGSKQIIAQAGGSKPAPLKAARVKSTGTNLLLAANGAVASGCINPQFLNDGDSTHFDGSTGYAHYDPVTQPDGAMLITLPRPVEISRLRLLLWNLDERTYRYTVAISADEKTWETVLDASKAEQAGWQEARFNPKPAKAIRVKGISTSMYNGFHVVELEGYNDGPVVPRRLPPKPLSAIREAQLKPGLWAEYYDKINSYPDLEDHPILARAESNLRFGFITPAADGKGLNGWPLAGPCAAIFSGYLKIEKESLYTFFVNSDDGAELYINGELVVENGGLHAMTESWGQIDLKPGFQHLWLSYFNGGGGMGLMVSQKRRGENREFLNPATLYHAPSESSPLTAQPSEPGAKQSASDSSKSATARLISIDTKRGGAWKKDLGKSGYVIFNQKGAGQHEIHLPDFILRCESQAEHYVYPLAENPLGLEDPGGGKARYCTVEYSGSEVIVTIRNRNRFRHKLSLYCVDFDKTGRRQRVSLQSGERVLHEQELADLTNGVWLHYEVCGSLDIRLINNSATNAVLSGIFWDAENSGQIAQRVPAGRLAPADAAGLQPGLWAEYFDKVDGYPAVEDRPLISRAESALAFGSSPIQPKDQGLRDWPFARTGAAVFSGYLNIDQDAAYTFGLAAGDEAKLFLDGALVVDCKGTPAMTEKSGRVELKKGLHSIWLAHFNTDGPLGLQVTIQKGNGPKEPLGGAWLLHPADGNSSQHPVAAR